MGEIREDVAFTFTCPSCGAAVPHEVTNTVCTTSGIVVDPNSFPPPPEGDHIPAEEEMTIWRDAAVDAYWMADRPPTEPEQGE